MLEREEQQLGSYRLLHLLGRGGFAEVYLGEHIYLKTPAAVKVLLARVASKDDLESFLKEAQLIARLSHPHIIRIVDFGVVGETPFLVMDYAVNGTLRQLYPKGTRLPLSTIVPYVKQIADALQYAHDERLIHRDIKPENLLLGRRNEVLLGDFGIALVAQSSRYQSTQDVIGTVAYMAPEQIQGKPRPASDQYSLGIVVYEWLCGEKPFQGSFTELCAQHMFAPPPPLHTKSVEISPEVEQVVMTALAKDPKQRFADIRAFALSLEQANQLLQPQHSMQQVSTQPAATLLSSTLISPVRPQNSPPIPSKQSTEIAPPTLPSTTSNKSRGGPSRTTAQVNITATTAPTPTSTPQDAYLQATSGSPAFSDQLTNQDSNQWDEDTECLFNNGTYHAKASGTDYFGYCIASRVTFSNFVYQVRMTIVQGNHGGIVFRVNVPKFYYFRIGQDGSYGMYLYNGIKGTFGQELRGGYSSAFNTGLNQSNLIAVVASGSQMALYINKQFVASTSDSSFSSGNIGVIAVPANSITEVAFSNAQVWT